MKTALRSVLVLVALPVIGLTAEGQSRQSATADRDEVERLIAHA